MTPELHNSLVVGAVLFVLGTIGFLTRRNLIVMFLSAELMLQAVALNLIAFGRVHGNYHGQSFTVFVLTVAACEAAIALVLVLSLYQISGSLDVKLWRDLGETGDNDNEPSRLTADELPRAEKGPAEPRLVPSGREPVLNKVSASARKEQAQRG